MIVEQEFTRLLKEARNGSRVAWWTILESYQGYLKTLAREFRQESRFSTGRESDFMQETFEKAGAKGPQFIGDLEPELRAWLRTILRNVVRAQVRKHKNRREMAGLAALAAQEDRRPVSSDDKELESAMRLAFSRLPPYHREIVQLKFHEKLSVEEIGLRLNKTPEAIRKILCLSMREVAEVLR